MSPHFITRKGYSKDGTQYRFDIAVNEIQVMQVFDTVSYLLQLNAHQAAH